MDFIDNVILNLINQTDFGLKDDSSPEEKIARIAIMTHKINIMWSALDNIITSKEFTANVDEYTAMIKRILKRINENERMSDNKCDDNEGVNPYETTGT